MTRHARSQQLIDDWNAYPRVSASLPITLPDGGVLETITGACPECKQGIPDEDLHGMVACVIPTVTTITAVGYCRACRSLSPVNQRFRAVSGGLWLEWINDDGKWVKRRLKTGTGDAASLAAYVRRIFGGLKRLVWE